MSQPRLEKLPRAKAFLRPTVLSIPGWHGSGPGHWQTLWERELDLRMVRVEQTSWEYPVCSLWVYNIDQYVRRSDEPIVLVAHSLGCLAVAHWAAWSKHTDRIAGALLVTPPWFERPQACPREIQGFAPLPDARLPFESTLVASETDPYCSIDEGQTLAGRWGSAFVNAGDCGHINVESGHGEWRQGQQILSELLAPLSIPLLQNR